MAEKHFANYLQHIDQYNLNVACVPLHRVFDFGPYLVGSVLTRPTWRDVDIRIMIPDDEWEATFKSREFILGAAVTEWLKLRTGLPIDFQFQQMTEANTNYGSQNGHSRSALGFAQGLSQYD